jgi:ribosomal-protein-alanine N-acetyltransferase
MSAVIRPAAPSDLAAILDIENAAFSSDRISRRGLRAMLSSASTAVLVAVEGDSLRGYCAVLFRAGSRNARLYSIAVAPGRRGVGRPLLAAAEQVAEERGAAELRLEVRADNARAMALYERAGYHLFDQIPDYYADGAMALRYAKSLVSPKSAATGTPEQ